MILEFPKLYFKKVHKKTKVEFVDYFTNKNLSDWDLLKLNDIPSRAQARIDYWNDVLGSEWDYSIIGWNALAAPEQEPIARVAKHLSILREEVMLYCPRHLPIGTPLYAKQAP